MKKYIKPTCDNINVATSEALMDGMSVIRIFDVDPNISDNSNYLIIDGSEVLTNSHLWEDDNEDENW